MNIIGYVRVSTDQQADSGAGLAAQRAAIEAETLRRGWTLLSIVEEGEGASSATLDRPALQGALRRLARGEADVLAVAKLDRLSRSVSQGAEIMEQARKRGWALVALDIGLDMTTPVGEMVASVILSASQYERRMIGVRTAEALHQKRLDGVRLGRPQQYPDEVVTRILSERSASRSLRTIADGLTRDGIPTARGGVAWQPSTIQAVLRSQRAAELATALRP